MSTLIFAQAKSIYNKAKKVKNDLIDHDPEFARQQYEAVINIERNRFREILSIAKQLHEDYIEIATLSTNNWYYVTVRPAPNITFGEFLKFVTKYVKRKCIIDFILTLEQKSTEDTGEGFHVHLVCDATWRSQQEALRDTASTFKKIAAENCIKIKTTREPQKIIDNYHIAYISKDDHKKGTKEGDAIWRANKGIEPLYKKNEDGIQKLETLSIKYGGTASNSITEYQIIKDTETITIDLN